MKTKECTLCKKEKSIENFGVKRNENGSPVYLDYCQKCKKDAVEQAKKAFWLNGKPKPKPKQTTLKVTRRSGDFEPLVGGM